MRAAKRIIAFLTDVNVPDSIGEYLRSRGHDVVRVRDVMAADSADTIVAEAALRDERVLVSWDRDFNHQRFLKPRFQSLHRIGLSCPEPDGRKRVEEVIDRIEYEHYKATTARALLLKIGRDRIQIRC